MVTAEVYCKALSTLITYVLERGRPDPSANATTTVVAIAKLENYLRKNVFGAFAREQPFSAHNLLESTMQRWVDSARGDLLEQVSATILLQVHSFGFGPKHRSKPASFSPRSKFVEAVMNLGSTTHGVSQVM